MFQGQNWTYVFNSPGTYDYYCLPHPWMLGKIVVE
jgi:plastocyanin